MPFFVIALTNSPAIMVPDGDAATFEQLFRRYHVQWLLLSKDGCLGRGESVCEAILSDRQKSLGELRLLHAKGAGELVLFHVIDGRRVPR
jgi:hypothetical protein